MTEPRRRFPPAIYYLLVFEGFNKFGSYGKAVISGIYLRKLEFSDNEATSMIHGMNMLRYFLSLFAAGIIDSWVGKYNGLMYSISISTLSSILIAVISFTPFHLPEREMIWTYLVLNALSVPVMAGTNVLIPFSGEQFHMPSENTLLQKYIVTSFYVSNFASVLARLVIPSLRSDIHCFDEPDCFSLGFGVASISYVLAFAIFLSGRRSYIISEPAGANIVSNVYQCIRYAILTRRKRRHTEPRQHWLDYADDKFEKALIADTKILISLFILFQPYIFYCAILAQQTTRWIFQSNTMKINIGDYDIKPEQTTVVNPLVNLIFTPIFYFGLFPLMERCGINTPLRKIGTGWIIAAVAYIVAGILQLAIERNQSSLPGKGVGQLRVFNGLECNMYISNVAVAPNEYFVRRNVPAQRLRSDIEKFSCPYNISIDDLYVQESKATSYFFTVENEDDFPSVITYEEQISTNELGYPYVRVLSTIKEKKNVFFKYAVDDTIDWKTDTQSLEVHAIAPTSYKVYVEDEFVQTVKLHKGGVYTVLLHKDKLNMYKLRIFTITDPYGISIFWQIPQIVLIAISELLFNVAHLEFLFTQAPVSMKMLTVAIFTLTNIFSEGLIMVIAVSNVIEKRSTEFFTYTAILVVDIVVFILLANRYKYVEYTVPPQDTISLGTVRSNY